MTGTIILIAAGAVLLIFVWWMIAIFNGLVRLRNAVKMPGRR